jgi:hypothetical protein
VKKLLAVLLLSLSGLVSAKDLPNDYIAYTVFQGKPVVAVFRSTQPCSNQDVLKFLREKEVPEDSIKQLKNGTLLWHDGKIYATCWANTGLMILAITEKGEQIQVPIWVIDEIGLRV